MTTRRQERIAEMSERGLAMLGELDQIEATFGADRAGWPTGQRERHERISTAVRALNAELAEDEAEEAKIQAVRNAAASGNVSRPAEYRDDAGARSTGSGPWRNLDSAAMRMESPDGWRSRAHDVLSTLGGITDSARATLADGIDSPEGGGIAAYVVARSHPAYETAFRKIVANPTRAMWALTPQERDAFAAVESVRATLGTGTSTGGYTIPLALDPSLAAIQNAGVANPFRMVATLKQTISSPGRFVTTTGVTAEWKTEGAAASDATPTFGRIDVPLYTLTAWAAASFEIIGDTGMVLGETLVELFADARNRAEGAAFATGTGSGQPTGVVTAVTAVTASRVAPTTGGTFTTASIPDVHKVWNALPARARQSTKAAWIANNSVLSIIRQADVYGGGQFLGDLTTGTPRTLIGAPVFEASAMTASITTGSNVLLVGDFSKYLIADHAAGPELQYIPALFDQATGRPNGTSGWLYMGRTGADVTDASQFAVLKL